MPDPVATPHQDTARQAAQAAEAAARSASGSAIPPNETAAALDAPSDTPQDPGPGRSAAPAPAAEEAAPERALPPVGSLGNDKRNAITARFRTARAETPPDDEAISDFTRSGGMPEDFRQAAGEQPAEGDGAPQPGNEPPAVAAPEPAPAPEPPKTVKIKVRGEEKEVPLDDVIAAARKAYAAEDYLDEAKGKLNEVNSLLRETKDRVTRPTQDGQPQATLNGAQPADPAQPVDPSLQPQESPVKKLVEAIQFGDPAEAEALLTNTIREAAKATTREEMLAQRIQQDTVKAQEAVKTFTETHADIANDRKSRAAVEADIQEQQAEDLKALNVDFNKIRQDGQPATPADIANYHRLLRANGYNVKSPAQMLETGIKNFLSWKGIKTPEPPADPTPPTPPQPPQQRNPAPRVEISVDRQRRPVTAQQLPQPPKPAPLPPPKPQDRSDVVKAMRELNASRRKQTLGIGA